MSRLWILLMVLMIGCSPAEDTPGFTMIGEWELVRSIDAWTGVETTGEDMWARETYIFSQDSTFRKQRIMDGVMSEATGGYIESGGGSSPPFVRNVTLTFRSGFEIIGACTPSEGIELLRVLEDGTMVNTWAACDGPELFYERR
jgi:hypothetical protein